MIGRIRGTVVEKELDQILVDVSGVGYEVEIPLSTWEKCPAVNEAVVLHTHLVVREDAQQLFGFYSLRERELFRALIRVNGVGPKLALVIQSSVDPETFVRCIREDDVKALVAVPGIGKKTAERLIIEMRDRLPDWEIESDVAGLPEENRDVLADAELALIGLGYRPQEASLALTRIEDPNQAVEGIIRQALKQLSDTRTG